MVWNISLTVSEKRYLEWVEDNLDIDEPETQQDLLSVIEKMRKNNLATFNKSIRSQKQARITERLIKRLEEAGNTLVSNKYQKMVLDAVKRSKSLSDVRSIPFDENTPEELKEAVREKYEALLRRLGEGRLRKKQSTQNERRRFFNEEIDRGMVQRSVFVKISSLSKYYGVSVSESAERLSELGVRVDEKGRILKK